MITKLEGGDLRGYSQQNAVFFKPAYRIQEVPTTGGAGGATSSWTGSGTGFDNGHHWHLGPEGGPPTPLPVMVWYDYKDKRIRPAEVG